MSQPKYNICLRCDEPCAGSDPGEICDSFRSSSWEKITCPYCGHIVDDYYELGSMGVLAYGERTVDCPWCRNPIQVTSEPRYELFVRPANEDIVECVGHPDYKEG